MGFLLKRASNSIVFFVELCGELSTGEIDNYESTSRSSLGE